MKKVIFSALLVITGVIALESFVLRVKRRDGTDPGYTGSPGDSLKNCTACHGGTPVNVNGWIRSNIPAVGYTPGQRYTLTAVNTEEGGTRFGFEVSPQALNGDMKGTFVITDTARTKLVGNDKYITYKDAGVDGVDSNKWTFDWMAPAKGAGDLHFYGAFNSNFEGHKSGDQTYLTKVFIKENLNASVKPIDLVVNNFSVFPNPTNGNVHITIDLKNTADVRLELADLSGRQVSVVANGKYSGTVSKTISTDGMPKGLYFVRLVVDGKSTTQKLTIIH